jgi:membrane fusion protein, heavy metal efflux system
MRTKAISRRFLTLLGLLATGLMVPGCGSSDPDAAVAGRDEHAGEAVAEGAEHSGEASHVVALDSSGIAAAGIRTGIVQTISTSGLMVTGAITYDANRVSHIGPRTEGRIIRMEADIGQQVRGGQVMAILESPAVGQVRAEQGEARALLAIAEENYDRERRLEAQGISSRKELLDAQADLRRAEAALTSATERLRTLGGGEGEGGEFAIASPFAGVVVEREASLGEIASPADQLFTVANLDRLWIELDVYERDLARVGIGQDVDVTVAAYPGRVFAGKIVYLGDVLDPERRTVRARVEVQNPDRALRPGMFANATIRVGGGGSPRPVVPRDAIQEVEGQPSVFVRGDHPGEFRAVPVEVGEAVGDGQVVILSGVEPGEEIVVAGAFMLRSELASGAIGEAGHGH